MIELREIKIDKKKFSALTIKLPKTTLLIISNDVGYVMCGALDVHVFNQPHLKKRKVIAARAVGVKTIDDLLNGEVEAATEAAERKGIVKGLSIKEALLKM